jgi:hypothetical protein
MKPPTIINHSFILNRTLGRWAAGLVVAAGVLLLATGCPPPPPPAEIIVLLDTSNSTTKARDDYIEHFADQTSELARDEGTSIHVILAAGEPLAESRITSTTFSSEEEGDWGELERVRQATSFTKRVDSLLKDPPIKDRNHTNLLEAFVLAGRQATKTEGPLKKIYVYGDGVERSKRLNMYRSKLDDKDIRTTLARLEESEGVIPKRSLRGLSVEWVLPGYHEGGWNGSVDIVRVEKFWKAYSQRVGANLTWG